jgi:glucokinase
MRKTIGIDLGGTYIKGVLMLENGEVLAKHTIATGEHVGDDWKETVRQMLQYLEAQNGGLADAVGLSAPGLANEQNTAIAFLPNRLEGLENFIWSDFLERKTLVLNDAHAAIMAEAKFGVLKNYKNALMLTLGTGVGGGIIINGELYQGMHQRAGHLGHIAVNLGDDELSILGIPGSLEYSIGNYSIQKRSHGRFSSTHDLVEAYEKGETFATYLWLDAVRKLGVSLASLINAFAPDAIALSGGIVLAGDALFTPLRDFINVYEFKPYNFSTPIFKSEFDDFAGAMGAAAFSLSKN